MTFEPLELGTYRDFVRRALAEDLSWGDSTVSAVESAFNTLANTVLSNNARTLEDLVKNLQAPRAIWIMVPSGDPVDETIAKLKPLCQQGDIFIDGGNSNYKDTQRRHDELKPQGFEFLDCGTSGGRGARQSPSESGLTAPNGMSAPVHGLK